MTGLIATLELSFSLPIPRIPAQIQIEHAGVALSSLLETIREKLSNFLSISKTESDAIKVEIYCPVCGLEVCYTE